METSRKYSQQELRQLMKEKAKSKKVDRIESPIAKYDEKNNLWCVICNIIVRSDSLWSSHLVDKLHKKKIEELKQKKLSKSEHNNKTKNLSDSRNLKRSLPIKDNEEHVSRKVSKFDKISEFSQKEILIKQAKNSISESAPKVETNTTTNIDSSLPQDFFDNKNQQNVEASQTTTSSNFNEPMEVDADIKKEALPEGFFDDPFLDAKARKPNNKDPFEEQMQLFRKEIAEETLASENIVEEEIEQLQKDKEITEIEEQLSNWSKVDKYQKRIEEIHRRKLEMRNNKKQIDNDDSDDVDDSEDSQSDNINDMNFWRSKDIFH